MEADIQPTQAQLHSPMEAAKEVPQAWSGLESSASIAEKEKEKPDFFRCEKIGDVLPPVDILPWMNSVVEAADNSPVCANKTALKSGGESNALVTTENEKPASKFAPKRIRSSKYGWVPSNYQEGPTKAFYYPYTFPPDGGPPAAHPRPLRAHHHGNENRYQPRPNVLRRANKKRAHKNYQPKNHMLTNAVNVQPPAGRSGVDVLMPPHGTNYSNRPHPYAPGFGSSMHFPFSGNPHNGTQSPLPQQTNKQRSYLEDLPAVHTATIDTLPGISGLDLLAALAIDVFKSPAATDLVEQQHFPFATNAAKMTVLQCSSVQVPNGEEPASRTFDQGQGDDSAMPRPIAEKPQVTTSISLASKLSLARASYGLQTGGGPPITYTTTVGQDRVFASTTALDCNGDLSGFKVARRDIATLGEEKENTQVLPRKKQKLLVASLKNSDPASGAASGPTLAMNTDEEGGFKLDQALVGSTGGTADTDCGERAVVRKLRVLCGRANGALAGNKAYVAMQSQHAPEYRTASATARSEIVNLFLQRFDFCKNDSEEVIMGYSAAREKVQRALQQKAKRLQSGEREGGAKLGLLRGSGRFACAGNKAYVAMLSQYAEEYRTCSAAARSEIIDLFLKRFDFCKKGSEEVMREKVQSALVRKAKKRQSGERAGEKLCVLAGNLHGADAGNTEYFAMLSEHADEYQTCKSTARSEIVDLFLQRFDFRKNDTEEVMVEYAARIKVQTALQRKVKMETGGREMETGGRAKGEKLCVLGGQRGRGGRASNMAYLAMLSQHAEEYRTASGPARSEIVDLFLQRFDFCKNDREQVIVGDSIARQKVVKALLFKSKHLAQNRADSADVSMKNGEGEAANVAQAVSNVVYQYDSGRSLTTILS